MRTKYYNCVCKRYIVVVIIQHYSHHSAYSEGRLEVIHTAFCNAISHISQLQVFGNAFLTARWSGRKSCLVSCFMLYVTAHRGDSETKC